MAPKKTNTVTRKAARAATRAPVSGNSSNKRLASRPTKKTTSAKNTVVDVGSSRGGNCSGCVRATARRGRNLNISSTVAAGSPETERTELLRCESEEEDVQFVSSDEVRDSDSETVVIRQGRERPIGLSNNDGAISTGDRVIQHSRSLRSGISRLDTREAVIETEDNNRNGKA